MITEGMLTGNELTEKADGIVPGKSHSHHRRLAGHAPRGYRTEGFRRRLSRDLHLSRDLLVGRRRVCPVNSRYLQAQSRVHVSRYSGVLNIMTLDVRRRLSRVTFRPLGRSGRAL